MEHAIRPLDAAAIGLYLLAMVAAGIYFARKNDTTEAYFVGNRNFSGWVLGLSMLGTIVSSATFLALPAAAYVLDWRQLNVNLVLPFVAVLAVLMFIPFFRQGNLTTAFEYLGALRGPRVYGTLSFILMQVIRMAQILFLRACRSRCLRGADDRRHQARPVHRLLHHCRDRGRGADRRHQAIILMLGGVLCFCLVAFDLPGLPPDLEVGPAQDKFSLGSFDWNLHERTFWTVAILGVINWLAIYGGDQNMVQRYAAARSTREARKATILYSAIALPLWIMFFFVGTSLFVYFQAFPDPAVAALESDQVLPYFILNRVPLRSPIMIAAVMAAAMSSLDSGINAISTVTVADLPVPDRARRPLLPARRAPRGVRRDHARGHWGHHLQLPAQGEHERRESDCDQCFRRLPDGPVHAGLLHHPRGRICGDHRDGSGHSLQHLPCAGTRRQTPRRHYPRNSQLLDRRTRQRRVSHLRLRNRLSSRQHARPGRAYNLDRNQRKRDRNAAQIVHFIYIIS